MVPKVFMVVLFLPISILANLDTSSKSKTVLQKCFNERTKNWRDCIGSESQMELDDEITKRPLNSTWAELLKKSLFTDYDKDAKPSSEVKATNVSLTLKIHHVELDDVAGIMILHGWIYTIWNDERLHWNETEFGGLENLRVGGHEIWKPDIINYDSAYGNTDEFGKSACTIYKTGHVICMSPVKLTTFCSANMKHWPHEVHACTFSFKSIINTARQIKIVDQYESVMLDLIANSSEWMMIDIKSEIDNALSTSYKKYYIHVTRRDGGNIKATLLRTPATISVFLSLLSHCLPPTFIRLPLIAAPPILLSFMLLYLANILQSSIEIPNIVMFHHINLYITCLSGIITVIVINSALIQNALPVIIKNMLCSRIARILQLPKIIKHRNCEEMQNAVENETDLNEDNVQILSKSSTPIKDWLILTLAIDRITFIVLLFIFVMSSIIYCR